MPIGRYIVQDGEGHPVGEEEFRCAPGPLGWRYFATIRTSDPEPHEETVDFVVDDRWRPVRLRVDTGSHSLFASVRDGTLTGVLDGEPLELPFGPQTELDYLSPCFNAVTANRLTATTEIEVVWLEPVTCRPELVRQRYELHGDEEVLTPVGTFIATRWQYTALGSGWSRPLWVAGDVVVAYEDLFELAEYDAGVSGVVPH